MEGKGTADLTPPTELRPPGVPPGSADRPPRRHYVIWVLLALLLGLAIAVVFALPSVLESAGQQQTVVAVEAPATRPDSTALRDAAQQALQGYLGLRAKMELDNAAVWGMPDWDAAASRASDGDRYFAQRKFGAAGREYGQALETLERLQEKRSILLSEALAQGRDALAVDDVDNAIKAFEAVLEIEPQHPAASKGVTEARARGMAIGHMDRGRLAEAGNDLEAARSAYEQALKADAGYAAATTALQRVSGEINAREFNQAMTAALQALDAGDTTAAAQAIGEAGRLQPNARAVADARQRLQAMRARAGLSRLRAQAQVRVREEDWQTAAGLYRRALGIDASAAFARTGLSHAEERASLHKQLDHYLEGPARLYSAAPLANAQKVLASAGIVPPSEPRLVAKVARLNELVAAAQTPISITLESDGETDVVVYRVARLGKLETHRLTLRPGDYTVVGSRPGYRDVRKVITVRPGGAVPPLSIRCEEKI